MPVSMKGKGEMSGFRRRLTLGGGILGLESLCLILEGTGAGGMDAWDHYNTPHLPFLSISCVLGTL